MSNIIRECPMKLDLDLSRCKSEPLQLEDIPLLQCGSIFDKNLLASKCTLKEIIQCVKEPKITDDKHKNDLWCFGECLDESKGHQKDNIIKKSKYFILDYDNGYSIEDFCEEYKDYFYILYTSYSHTKEHNKFRVIMYGNYEVPFTEDEQSAILSETFRNADQTTFQPNRIFYMPAHKEGAEYIYKFNNGKQFPLYNYVISTLAETKKKYREEEEARTKAFVDYHKKKKDIDCTKCTSVQRYLNTSYPNEKGNGDSNLNLYKAICCCVKYDDYTTLELVKDKAKREHWTDKELEQKIKSARSIK